jgi:hypothetical protein
MGLFKKFTGSNKSANSSVVDVPVQPSKKASSNKSKKESKTPVDFPKYPVLKLQMFLI